MVKDDRDIALYQEACQEFPVAKHRTDTRGGVQITYLDGETITTHLNEVFGVFGWSFTVIADGINEEADEAWCRGRLEIYKVQQLDRFDPATNAVITMEVIHTSTREQYGSQKLKRARSSGKVLDIGFDLKGAATDALKKCASLVGVGLYLWNKDEGALERARRAEQANAVIINGIEFSRGFRQPFELNLTEELSDDICRARDCGKPVLDDEKFTVGDREVDGNYVKTRAIEVAGCVLCFDHTREWSDAKKASEPRKRTNNKSGRAA